MGSFQRAQAAHARDPHGKKDHSKPTVATVQAEGEKASGFSVISQRRLMTNRQTGSGINGAGLPITATGFEAGLAVSSQVQRNGLPS
jgi:hypothetical protein